MCVVGFPKEKEKKTPKPQMRGVESRHWNLEGRIETLNLGGRIETLDLGGRIGFHCESSAECSSFGVKFFVWVLHTKKNRLL